MSRLARLAVYALLLCWQLAGAAEPLKIVAIYPKTGPMATSANGGKFVLGIRLAIDELNQRGGLQGRQLTLLEFDSASTALNARAAALAAVRERPLAVIGDRVSSLSLVLAPIMQAAGIPMISPTSTHPDVTLAGDYIFRVCAIDAFQGRILAEFASRELHANSAVVLTNASAKYSVDLSHNFMVQFRAGGGHILAEADYLQDATDFAPLLDKVAALAPAVLFIPGYERDAGMLMRQARARGVRAVFLGGDGWGAGTRALAGPAIVGSYRAAQWQRDDPGALSQAFVKRFEQEYGAVTGDGEALAYDAVMLLADAVGRANSLAAPDIRRALAATRRLPLVTGTVTIDANRDPQRPMVIVRYDSDSMHYVKSIAP